MAGYEALIRYLRQRQVSFEVQKHPIAYTAQEIAAQEHVPGRMFAKVVMAEADGRLVMLVLPAHYRVDTWKAAELLGAEEVRLAREPEFARTFADCDVGAMPPFGNLYRVPVFVDESLTEDERIVFQAGSHQRTISMRYADFARLVRPEVGAFGVSPRTRRRMEARATPA